MANSAIVQRPPSTTVRLGVILAMAVFAILACGPTKAAAAGEDDAKRRAMLFQEEARKIFEKDHWTIVRKGEAGFTAVHNAVPGDTPAQGDAGDQATPVLVHVSITFNPKTIDSTDCVVKVEGFHLIPRSKGKKSHLEGPFKADYPENANYIRTVLEAAEDRVGQKHPQFQAK